MVGFNEFYDQIIVMAFLYKFLKNELRTVTFTTYPVTTCCNKIQLKLTGRLHVLR